MSVLDIFKTFDPEKVLETVNNRNLPSRFILFLFGTLLLALSFNIFLSPNNFVIGGISGAAIIVAKLSSLSAASFIFFANLGLIGLSLLLLGKDKLINNILGALCFSIFVYLTQDINLLLKIHFNNQLLYVICGGVLYGTGSGLVFKTGFSSGGGDILGLIISKYIKQPIGKSMLIMNAIIVIIGGLIFGYTMVMYAIIINYISTLIIDKILLGISDSKMFMIDTDKEDEVKELILKGMHSGVTVLKARGGYIKTKKDVLMCIVSTRDYFSLKEAIQEIDPDAFIVVSDCYEVYGGTKRNYGVEF